MARLWRDEGKREEAAIFSAPICGGRLALWVFLAQVIPPP